MTTQHMGFDTKQQVANHVQRHSHANLVCAGVSRRSRWCSSCWRANMQS
jgi:hypothetical protein